MYKQVLDVDHVYRSLILDLYDSSGYTYTMNMYAYEYKSNFALLHCTAHAPAGNVYDFLLSCTMFLITNGV